MFIKVIDWIYSPINDNIYLLFDAPNLLAWVQFKINRHEDLPSKITELKDKISRGDI